MKKFAWLLSLVLAAGLAGAAAPAATTPTAKKAPSKTAAVKTHKLTGEVVTADATAKLLTVKGAKKNSTFAVDAKAEASLASLKAGDKVTVSYQKNAQGEHVAFAIAPAAVKKTVSAKKTTAAPTPATVK
jgi:hypothetical protein